MLKKSALVSLSLLSSIACQNESVDDHGKAKNRDELILPAISLVSQQFGTQTFEESEETPLVFSLPLGSPLLGEEKDIKKDLRNIITLQKVVLKDGAEKPELEVLDDSLYELSIKNDQVEIILHRHKLDWDAGDYKLKFTGGKLGNGHFFKQNEGDISLDFEVAELSRYIVQLEKDSDLFLDVDQDILLSDSERKLAKESVSDYIVLKTIKFDLLSSLDSFRETSMKLKSEEDAKKVDSLKKSLGTTKSQLASSLNEIPDLTFCGEEECTDRLEYNQDSEGLLDVSLDLLAKIKTHQASLANVGFHTVSYEILEYQNNLAKEEGLVQASIGDLNINYSTLIDLQGKLKMAKMEKVDDEDKDKETEIQSSNFLADFDYELGSINFLIKKTYLDAEYSKNKPESFGFVRFDQSDSGFTDLQNGFSLNDAFKVNISAQK